MPSFGCIAAGHQLGITGRTSANADLGDGGNERPQSNRLPSLMVWAARLASYTLLDVLPLSGALPNVKESSPFSP